MRIDWGYVYVAAPQKGTVRQYISQSATALNTFITGRSDKSFISGGKKLTLSTVLPVNLTGTAAVAQHILIGYDDLYSVQYFGKDLLPWWNHKSDHTQLRYVALQQQYQLN